MENRMNALPLINRVNLYMVRWAIAYYRYCIAIAGTSHRLQDAIAELETEELRIDLQLRDWT